MQSTFFARAQQNWSEARTLGIPWHACEVPLLPNRDELADDLACHYRQLLVEGFTAPSDAGGRVRLQLTASPGAKLDSVSFLKELSLIETRHPSEIALIRKAVTQETNRLSEAQRLIGSLQIGIDELTEVLGSCKRNEGELQLCLTRNPILFGLEYRRILPKHRLGAEFEMDYALERFSGIVDLVEIEIQQPAAV